VKTWNGLNARKYPNLVRLGLAGVIFVDQSVIGAAAIVGIAADETEVILGDEETLDDTEAYLASHPDPSDW
jgi:hypothetical protein